jgi:imidazolonepropionase-like amidohydrolase
MRTAFSAALLAGLMLLHAPAQGQTIAITGGKVVTNTSQGILESAVVVIRDGRIVSVGQGSAPAGATTVDAAGKWVTPGLFAAFSRVGVSEINGEDGADDASAAASRFQMSLRTADSFNPSDTSVPVTRIEGVTRIAIVGEPGSGLLAGVGALADTSGAFDSVFAREAFAYARLGEAGAALAGGSRAATWAWLEAAVADARAYPARYDDGGEGEVLSRRDAAAFLPVVQGRIPLMVETHRASDILALIDFTRRHPSMRFVVLGAAEGWRVADQLAAARIPVVVNPLTNLPDRLEILGSTLENAARLSRSGVTVAIADPNEATHNTRLIPQLAGNAVANGMAWQAAFAAISSVPASLFGREDLGVLAPGAIADVVVWDGDPLEVMSSPDAVYIDGVATPMTSRQTLLRDRYLAPPDADPHAYRY